MTRNVNFGVEVVSLSSWRAWIEMWTCKDCVYADV